MTKTRPAAHGGRWFLTMLALAAAAMTAACGSVSSAQPTPAPPVVVEKLDGGLSRITLSARASERLGIATAPVALETVDGVTRSTIPYAALLYDAAGNAWAFVSTGPLVFVRQALTVARIRGAVVLLSAGPAPGTAVVTVGAAELYGAESGLGGGH